MIDLCKRTLYLWLKVDLNTTTTTRLSNSFIELDLQNQTFVRSVVVWKPWSLKWLRQWFIWRPRMQGKVLDKHKSCYSALWGLYFGQHKLKLHIGLHTILSNMDMAHVNFLQKILIFCQTRLHPMDHPSLRNTTFHNVTSSLISPEP